MSATNRFRCDNETGETITYEVNEETGEPSLINIEPRIFHTFTQPSSIRKPFHFPGGSTSNDKRFQALKANILAGANTTSPRMLLIITTLMVFSKLCCLVLMVLEVFLHVRCHKKNKNLKDPNLYFRSPFHVITSIFCGVCRDNDMACKIGQMQDKRHNRYDYLKGIAI